ncbi:putative ABC transport system substrate-binding protein [Vibrio crassostreae]|uniref:ABC transporter substrate binding protein n=1 Tax=Vibrio crassostreae TaxID=246167 RepID=UPI0005DDB1E8|nr:ABC transporter substrate binding protein [Vibrio crassostreae]TCT67530.1 putative ABC transport system substrate-binding protein [Vibrio crassostreae]TCT87039.1 putative ABC transport system substrate-binding protein [Vibrio crassostreae]TCU07998.1 putative ABC transport system substrate-binding protein [Vibrio crassostreae]TDW13404.1 putative ABC transport system substrate-binding protein [Vibrio crassostreae]CAK1750549.1 putative ABC transport system substrate-binding protein [Vibrio cra
MGFVRKVLTTALSGCLLLWASSAVANIAKVSVSQVVDHPDLNATRLGLLEGLRAKGYEPGKNLEFSYEMADGNPAQAAKIARELVSENPHVLVGIATPTSQALVSATRSIPIVFTAVTDPIGARLVKQLEKPGRNVTGLSDLSPITQHVSLIKELLPEANSIGVVYNPAEANAVALVGLLKKATRDFGFTLYTERALTIDDVESKAESVAKKSDVIYALTDNTVASGMEDLINAANQAGTPVVAGATSYVGKGAIAGLGLDYYDVGVQTADYVAAILNGQKPGKLNVKTAQSSQLVVNLEAARELGVTLPQSVIDRAIVSR